MLLALGAASSAIDALKSLTSSVSSSSASTGFGKRSADPFGLSGDTSPSGSSAPATGFTGGGSQISPATMSALLAAQSQTGSTASAPTSRSSALQDLFSQIDGNGDGQISKSEFENALGAGGTNLAQADDVFSKLDTNGDGSVSLGEMSSALKGAGGKGGHHHHAHVAGSSGSGTNGSSATGATSTSVANSNGSTTTSLTYADGSSVSMTSAPATTSSSTATASYNLLEQMIQREAQAISFSPTSLSFSA
jgi:Ca2+-binding EF-hand superfamily protein